jgi:hypothetical protein
VVKVLVLGQKRGKVAEKNLEKTYLRTPIPGMVEDGNHLSDRSRVLEVCERDEPPVMGSSLPFDKTFEIQVMDNIFLRRIGKELAFPASKF